MAHLMVHLVAEAKVTGPVTFRSMHPIERSLGYLKHQVHNRAHPEGSIAENYIADECMNFTSRYLHGTETRLTRPARNKEGVFYFFQGEARDYPRHFLVQAHGYVLNNLAIVKEYRSKHFEELKRHQRGKTRRRQLDNRHMKEFTFWFQDHRKRSTISVPSSSFIPFTHNSTGTCILRYVFTKICKALGQWRHELRSQHFEPYDNDFDWFYYLPTRVDPLHFAALMSYWNTDHFKKKSKISQENRSKNELDHLLGSMSMVNLEYNMVKKAGGPVTIDKVATEAYMP